MASLTPPLHPFILGWLRRLGASRSDLLIENLALRQQLAILTAKRPRPRMRAPDRFFWVALRRFWPRWKEALVVIRPDTVVRWHRAAVSRQNVIRVGTERFAHRVLRRRLSVAVRERQSRWASESTNLVERRDREATCSRS